MISLHEYKQYKACDSFLWVRELAPHSGEDDTEPDYLSVDFRRILYNSLLMTNLTHFFISLFITPFYMFRASQCSSSGDRIVLLHHLV